MKYAAKSYLVVVCDARNDAMKYEGWLTKEKEPPVGVVLEIK